MSELLEGITDIDYHSGGGLSSTGARKLLDCPARFRYEQLNPPASTGVFDFGKLAHKLILGEGADIVPIDFPDYRTKDAKALRDEARAEGKIPALASEVAAAEQMASRVHAHPAANVLFSDGRPEVSGSWVDEATRTTLRFRPDWLTDDTCVDVKTCASADPAVFGKSVANYRYHLQAAWYIAGLAAHGIDARFVFVCVEKTPPFLVSVIELDQEALMEGARLMRQAVDLYAHCVDTDTWPAYGDTIHQISLPHWALKARDQAIYDEAAELERNWDDIFSS